jgi:N-acetylneuraminic acid mutarotase
VLDGKLYTVAGCVLGSCKTDVEVYDPQANTWSAAAAYPEADGGLACGGISGQIYCSGGNSGRAYVPRAYVYDPVGNAWAQIPSPPQAAAYAGYTVANGKLLISGGSTSTAHTNSSAPSAPTWPPPPSTASAS